VRWLLIWVVALVLAPGTASAMVDSLPDAAQEARAQQIESQLRCVVCDGEALTQSQALIARQMRIWIREQVAAGAADQDILDRLEIRYGQQVRLDGGGVGGLWLMMPVLLVVGGGLVLLAVRRRALRFGRSVGES